MEDLKEEVCYSSCNSADFIVAIQCAKWAFFYSKESAPLMDLIKYFKVEYDGQRTSIWHNKHKFSTTKMSSILTFFGFIDRRQRPVANLFNSSDLEIDTIFKKKKKNTLGDNENTNHVTDIIILCF